MVLLVVISISTIVGVDGAGVAVRSASDTVGGDNNADGPSSSSSERRKPYRSSSAYNGKIKLVPNRKILVLTTEEEWDRYQRLDRSSIEAESSSSSVSPTRSNGFGRGSSADDLDPTAPPDLGTMLAPFVKRGLLLAALTALAIVDRTPSTAAAALSSSPGMLPAAVSLSGRWRGPFAGVGIRLDWMKLRSLPGEILPSLTAAMMIAWVPSLVLQRAWFELGFLVLSLTSEANLRSYLWNEVLPAMGGTVRKLFWSEFWKQAWDYLLEPFSHNILIPTRSSSAEVNPAWTQWQSEVARFWSDRVVSRIDKWTASSIKALLQKNVQSSVNGIAEDSWKAVAFAWYPDGGSIQPGRAELPGSNEDTARMIEIEASCEDGNDGADCEEEDFSDSSSSLTSDCDDPRIEEPQPVVLES